jgi:hypothetical protein
MLVGAVIPCYYLDNYLGAVCEQFNYDKKVVSKDFKVTPEHEVRNGLLQDMWGYDWLFTVDADEFILKQDQERILNDLKDHDAVFIPVINYTKDLEHRYKMRDHKPVVLVNPKKVHFYEGRCLRYSKPLVYEDIYLHHLGFTYDNEKTEWKKSRYWDNKNPKEYEQILEMETEECSLPDEIRSLIC